VGTLKYVSIHLGRVTGVALPAFHVHDPARSVLSRGMPRLSSASFSAVSLKAIGFRSWA
jgi:hypothetical protein